MKIRENPIFLGFDEKAMILRCAPADMIVFILNYLSDEELCAFAERVVKGIESYISAPFRKTEMYKQLVEAGKWPVEDEQNLPKLKEELENLVNRFKSMSKSCEDVAKVRGKIVEVLLDIIWRWQIIQCTLTSEGIMKVKYVSEG